MAKNQRKRVARPKPDVAPPQLRELARLELEIRRLSRELKKVECQYQMLKLEIEYLGLEIPWMAQASSAENRSFRRRCRSPR